MKHNRHQFRNISNLEIVAVHSLAFILSTVVGGMIALAFYSLILK